MKKETIEVLIDLNNGNSFPVSKDIERNLHETIFKLVNLNILRKENNSIKVNNRKLLSKVVEFESIPKYLEWFDNKEDNSKIELKFDNFIGGDNLGIQSSNSDFNNPTIQNIKKNNEPIKPTISVLKTIYWIFGILVAITILYVFIKKVFNL
jgi:hypothetical protein